MALPKLSEKLHRRLTVREPMLFRLANVGKKDKMIDEGNSEALHGGSFPPTTTIYDKFETDRSQMRKIVSNVVGTKPEKRGNETIYVDDVEYVRFSPTGNLIVFPEQVHLLAYLRLSDNNGSNPYRDQTKPVLWVEANSPDVELRSRVREADLQLEAELMIVNMPWDKLKPFAAEFIKIAGRKSEEVRWDMRQLAKEPGMSRAILSSAPDEEMRIKLMVADAKSLRILVFAQGHGWRFEDEEGKYFFKPEIGVNPDQALVKWLVSEDGKERAQQLSETLQESSDEE